MTRAPEPSAHAGIAIACQEGGHAAIKAPRIAADAISALATCPVRLLAPVAASPKGEGTSSPASAPAQLVVACGSESAPRGDKVSALVRA